MSSKKRKKGRRPFKRSTDTQTYLKVFVIATEGAKTEQEYFEIFRDLLKGMVRLVPSNNQSDPQSVRKRMQKFLKDKKLSRPYEAWLVVDWDEQREKPLNQVHRWTQTENSREQKRQNTLSQKKKKEDSNYYGLALSNPKFEYWLLLHFEAGTDIASSRDCDERLEKCLPNYNKEIQKDKFPLERIKEATRRAELRDQSLSYEWPPVFGVTTVYKLVKKLLRAQAEIDAAPRTQDL